MFSAPTRPRIRRVRPRTSRWALPLTAILVPLTLLSATGSATADTLMCMPPDSPNPLAGSSTRAQVTQQATNTWDDWIWRGPTSLCPTGVVTCSYSYGESHTQSFPRSVSETADGVGNSTAMLLDHIPWHGVTGSSTVSFTWVTALQPGQFVQPVHVVQRRWESGVFVGGWVRRPYLDAQCRATGRDTSNTAMYEWDGNASFGSWQHSVLVKDSGRYNIWS